MSVSVKITVFRNSGKGCRQDKRWEEVERRRFSVDEGAATSYDYFRAKVVNVIPRLQDKAFRLYWKDHEGDLIAFSSDEELIEALGQLHRDDHRTERSGDSGLFRVYVEDFVDANSCHLPSFDPAAAASGMFHNPNQSCYAGSAPVIPPLMEFFLQMASTAAAAGAANANGCDGAKQGARCAAGFSNCGATAGTSCCGQRERFAAAPAAAAAASPGEKKDDPDQSNGTTAEKEHSTGAENENVNAGQDNGQQSQGSPPSSSADGAEQRESTTSSGGEERTNNGANSEQSPLSDRLIQVVETLKEMGVNDDNGWLTRLVASHSGSVEQLVEFAQHCCAEARTAASSASACNC